MRKRLLISCATLLVGAFGYGQATTQRQAPAPAQPAATAQRPAAGAATTVAAQRALLDQYCVTCHSDRLKTGNLSLEKLDVTHVGDSAEVWEKVVRKLRAGMMPPIGVKRPEPPAYEA